MHIYPRSSFLLRSSYIYLNPSLQTCSVLIHDYIHFSSLYHLSLLFFFWASMESLRQCMVLVMIFMSLCSGILCAPQVPCLFIFGDSLVDNGNNNRLQSLARADYMPYGIDFPGGRPTGRFSNGKTTVDVIGELSASRHYLTKLLKFSGLNVTVQ